MNFKILSRILLTGFFIIFSLLAYAQNDTSFLHHATISLEKYSSAYPSEKTYLQLDKSNYDLGDTVWYKAYIVTGEHHQLSALSGVLYVELIDPADTVMSRQILHFSSGVSWGGMPLPDKAKPGDYYIRAYTNWMRNAGAEYFYNQKIHVGGYEPTTVKKAVQLTGLDVQFFPEGGWLVNGLRSKVAIKAVNANGYGQNIKGTIEDNTGNVLVDFETRHLGMGVFAFTPQSGKTYQAKIKYGETVMTIPLPTARQQGYVMGINNSGADSIMIKVAVNEQLFREKQHTAFSIVAQSAGKIYFASTGKLEDMIFTAAVDKKRFPSGIVQFTLFSENGEPLNERSAFIRNNDTLKLGIETAKTQAMRGKVKIDLDAKNAHNKSTVGTFSVAVIDEDIAASNEQTEANILTSLVLTSDLKGYIEQPNYYFTNQNEQTRADLDALLLTQGYQRFEWKAILNNTAPAIAYQPEDALELAGRITTPGGKPVPNGKISLLAIRNNLMADTVTDANGNFKFTNLELPDSARIVLSAKKMSNSNNVLISVTPKNYVAVLKHYETADTTGVANTAVTANTPANNTNIYKQQRLDFLNKKHQLKDVTIKATRHFVREKPDLANSDNLNGPGRANQVIMADDLKGCPVLSDCLQGKVTGRGLTISKRAGSIAVFIDGAIQEYNFNLDDINPNIIHSIEVLTSRAYTGIYGGLAFHGALIITTKRSGDKDFYNTDPVPGNLRYTFNGFYVAKEFYSPKYDAPKKNAALPDLRSTIYWNPNVITDEQGKASVEYFNADTKGTYRVVIEGIDDDGNLGRQVYRYEVK